MSDGVKKLSEKEKMTEERGDDPRESSGKTDSHQNFFER